MKKTLLLSLVLASGFSFGQSLTQSNEPAIGATQVMFLCDSFANTYSATTGTGVTWDYSNLAGYLGYQKNVSIGDATASPNAADFPTSVKTIQIENLLTTFFNSTATERVSQGFVYNEPSFGDVLAKFSADELTMVTYPFAYGDYFSDIFSGTLDYTFNAIPSQSAASGSAHTWIDGQGTLILPGSGNSYVDVIRYKSLDTSATTIPAFNLDVEIVREQYEYYNPLTSSSNLPLFLISNIKIAQAGGGGVFADQTIVLSVDAPTTFVGLNDAEMVEFNAYPNPASDVVTVTGTFGADANYTLLDQSGRVLGQNTLSNGTAIDLSTYQTGIYLLKVNNNGASTTKTIVKK